MRGPNVERSVDDRTAEGAALHMLWIGDKYFSGSSGDQGRVVPRLDLAIAAVAGHEREWASCIMHHSDEERGWGFGHEVEVEYANIPDFSDILTFFAASDMGRRRLAEFPDWPNWSWAPMTSNGAVPSTGTAAIMDRIGRTVIAGWVIAAENGRIDEDTTWCKRTLLFATPHAFVLLSEDTTTLH